MLDDVVWLWMFGGRICGCRGRGRLKGVSEISKLVCQLRVTSGVDSQAAGPVHWTNAGREVKVDASLVWRHASTHDSTITPFRTTGFSNER